MGRCADRAEDLIGLVDLGVAVPDALARIGWNANAAYRWGLRCSRTDIVNLVRPEYNIYRAHNDRAHRASKAGA